MSTTKRKRWVLFFASIAGLMSLQLVWWTAVFLKSVDVRENLLIENQTLRKETHVLSAEELSVLRQEAFHKRVMFLSESACFLLLTLIGLWLLYRALRVEQKVLYDQKRFVEMVSHESKTPLTALKLRLESVLEKHSDETPLGQELVLALQEVRRLSSILDKVLNWQRVERGIYSLETVSLSEVVTAVSRRLEPFLKQNHVKLEQILDPEITVEGDVFALQNVVQSLVENAVFYNPLPDKRVRIEVKKRDAFVELSVIDNGPGVSEQEERLIFDRFYRGSSGKTTPGTGLGLYLVRTIVEAHKGTIELLRGIQNGCKFRVSFPEGERLA